jgi:hypothetical protein
MEEGRESQFEVDYLLLMPATSWRAGAHPCPLPCHVLACWCSSLPTALPRPCVLVLIPAHCPALQVIVEKADAGDRDTLRHALDLFVNFAAIFVRLLIILLKNAEQRKQRDARDKGRRRRD